jgi:hypothetical protein
MAQREPVARIEAILPMDGQECAKRRPFHAPSETGPGASMAAFDQSRDDRAAERERCLRRRDQSIVVPTVEARSPRPDGGIALPLCEASHATPVQAMITCRPKRDVGSWVADEAASEATQCCLGLLAVTTMGRERRCQGRSASFRIASNNR